MWHKITATALIGQQAIAQFRSRSLEPRSNQINACDLIA
ncbi:hypothetical protein MGWOODY_XGa2095 [hydrothermal vent metagenome]|uniref:Uncharacterized protein n=1 Tax=hydrothermal vent metagenome TaxID=652676 RepID=A0A160TX08_9ZZZZ